MKQCPKCKAEYPDTQFFCANCGSPLKNTAPPAKAPRPQGQKKQPPKILTALMAAGLAVTLIVLGLSYSYQEQELAHYRSEARTYRSEADLYQAQANRYSELYEDVQPELTFFRSYARIIPCDSSGTRSSLYHKYGCQDCDLSNILICNINLAKTYASPCPKCCPND